MNLSQSNCHVSRRGKSDDCVFFPNQSVLSKGGTKAVGKRLTKLWQCFGRKLFGKKLDEQGARDHGCAPLVECNMGKPNFSRDS